MAKRVTADSWSEMTGRDETGAIIDIKFTCPYCDSTNYANFFVRPSNFGIIDSGFETDQECDDCGKKVIVECR